MPDWTDRVPAATFDLHGQSVSEAALNAERFLRAQAKARPGDVVRLITGRDARVVALRSVPGFGCCSAP